MSSEKQVIPIIQSPPEKRRKERVAAYCRVSTQAEEQLHSLAAQWEFYEKSLSGNSKVEFVGIYADATVIIGLKQNPTNGRRFSPIFLLYRAFCGAKHRMPL